MTIKAKPKNQSGQSDSKINSPELTFIVQANLVLYLFSIRFSNNRINVQKFCTFYSFLFCLFLLYVSFTNYSWWNDKQSRP